MERRAEFPAAVRRIIAERAGYQCSVLNCGRLTVGPGPGKRQTVEIGMAAHIYAASPDGPRGTGGLSDSERREPENGIWCCYSHGKAIDGEAGRVFSAADLKAWKRLHEARKGAEVIGSPVDKFGLVESIEINSAPGSLSGKTFQLGMRNIITGPNGSGKSVLARLIASVAHPDHVATISRHREVDFGVRWFDPLTHDLATQGRSGAVTHILDGRSVPYVARPYKTIHLGDLGNRQQPDIRNLVSLSQTFDLSLSAMKATLQMLSESSDLIKEVRFSGQTIEWRTQLHGRSAVWLNHPFHGVESPLILLDIAAFHARHHAVVEPTILLVDEFSTLAGSAASSQALDRLQVAAEHAQVAVITHLSGAAEGFPAEWSVSELAVDSGLHRPIDVDCPINFEIRALPPKSVGG